MKRWLIWLLALLLILSGCQEAPAQDTTTEQTVPSTAETTLPPAPSIYVPGSQLEQQTGGAVQVFSTEAGYLLSYCFMGEDILLFYSPEPGSTNVLRMSGSDGTVISEAPFPDGAQLWGGLAASENRITAHDLTNNCILMLDGQFRELDWVALPENIMGSVLISQDQTTAYYSTGEEIRALDLSTGIPRLVMQQEGKEIYLNWLLFGDTVLSCYVQSGSEGYEEFFSAEDGHSLGSDENFSNISTGDSLYMLRRYDGPVTELLIGHWGGESQSFSQVDANGSFFLLPDINALAETVSEDTGTRLNLYELDRGTRTASILLEDVFSVYDLREDPSGRYIWFTMTDYEAEQDLLCRWDLSLTEGADQTVRLGKRYTAQDPDLEGIARCRETADRLEAAYGVEIHLYQEPVEPYDYRFVAEYQVSAIEQALAALETAMSKFPQSFLETAASVTESGRLQIGIVRALKGEEYNTLSDATAVQYWLEGDAYIALTSGGSLEQDFYHELSHALDTYVYANSAQYDYWEAQNPEGFTYDYSYTDYDQHWESPLLDPENRAFIDAYSMTYPHEDRARVMEYAMMEGNEEYFASDIMQAKLKLMCKAIRQAFGWRKSELNFPWEQYLHESLAYVKKK